MTIFFKGIHPTHALNQSNLSQNGLTAVNPGATPSLDAMMAHVCYTTRTSPYLSLTKSFGVAEMYAFGGPVPPTQTSPGYVWEIDILASAGVKLIDPVQEVAAANSDPFANISYHHDGDMDFLLGIVDPSMLSGSPLKARVPPGQDGPGAPHATKQLRTMVHALRDAEILAVGIIPQSCFRLRHVVW